MYVCVHSEKISQDNILYFFFFLDSLLSSSLLSLHPFFLFIFYIYVLHIFVCNNQIIHLSFLCFRIAIKIIRFLLNRSLFLSLSLCISHLALTSGHTLIRAARMVGDGARDKEGERDEEDGDTKMRKERKKEKS